MAGAPPATLMAVQTNDDVDITGGTLTDVTLTNPTITGASITIPTALKGAVTINGTTPVTISSSSILTTSAFTFSLRTVGGTVGALPAIQTITAGQITLLGTASDTSTYNYFITQTA